MRYYSLASYDMTHGLQPTHADSDAGTSQLGTGGSCIVAARLREVPPSLPDAPSLGGYVSEATNEGTIVIPIIAIPTIVIPTNKLIINIIVIPTN